MKVYRYLSETELNSILNGKTNNVGNIFIKRREFTKKTSVRPNNHKYKNNEQYIHFFKNLQDIEHRRSELRTSDENYYFCCFEVPRLVLFMAAGKGYYSSLHGYEHYIETVREYAVNIKNFKPNWLTGYALDNDKTVFYHKENYDNLEFNKKEK